MAHADELSAGQRFEFGANWSQFLKMLDDERIAQARKSLIEMLGIDNLQGRRFLDVGSGSGLFSLVARQLGAKVHSFDYDPKSVACTRELRRRHFDGDDDWQVEEGSVLDRAFVDGLGIHDIVYSWGVLHHTGQMRRALDHAADRVKPGGLLFISIYNDQGGTSNRWRMVKRIYCSSWLGSFIVRLCFYPYFGLGRFLSDMRNGRNPLKSYEAYKASRGMSVVHDWKDWLGGYPFEVAKPEDIFYHFRNLGFSLERLKTCGGGLGCNEYVFRRPER